MKHIITIFAALLFAATTVLAAEPNSYQVTGPVLEVTGDLIVVQKGKEKWEIARDKDTKVIAEPKVGDKVTIHYKMKATDIEVKGEGKKK
jgi:hypothetical protein